MQNFSKLSLKSKLIISILWLLSKIPVLFTMIIFNIFKLLRIKKFKKNDLVISKNLAICFPQKNELQRINIKNGYKCNFQYIIHILPKVWLGSSKFDKYINSVKSLDLIEKSLSSKQKTIILFPHLGNWELACQFVIRHFADSQFSTLVKFNGDFDEVLSYARNYHLPNNNLYSASVKGVGAAIKNLNNGVPLLMAPDQVPATESAGCYAPFFGINTLSFKLLSRILQKYPDTNVFFNLAIRNKNKFDIVILKLDNPKLSDKDLTVSVSALNTELEQIITKYPDNFLWSYKRFKKSKPEFYY